MSLANVRSLMGLPKTQKACCPRCQQRLEDCTFEGHKVKVCPKCAGLWVKPTAWDQERLGALPKFGAGRVGARMRAPDVKAAGRSQLVCPDCRTALTALQVGGPPDEDGTSVQIDQCDSCGGSWFDNGEWEQIEALRAVQSEEKRAGEPTSWGDWMFQFFLGLPVEFNVAPRRFPVVNIFIIALCILGYGIELCLSDDTINAWGFVPAQMFTAHGLVTLFTCLFMHASLAHLLGNMYFLYILGDNVEDALGRWYYLIFYLVCGITASFVFALLNFESSDPLVGASGAISGVMAAYLLLYPQARLTFMLIVWQFKVRAPIWLGCWFLFQLVASLLSLTHTTTATSNVAFVAHVSGFLAGLVIVGPLRPSLIKGNSLLTLLHKWKHPKPARAQV